MERTQRLLIDYGLATQEGETIKVLPRPENIHRFLTMHEDEINQTNLSVLEEGQLVLSAYLLYIRLQHNLRRAEMLKAKKRYNERLAIELRSVQAPTKGERESFAVEAVPELKALKEEFLTAEISLALTEEFPDDVKERLNVFKKIYGDRSDERNRAR